MTVIDTTSLADRGSAAPTTVHLSGEIDIFTSPALRERLLNALWYGPSLLILDMSEVSFCDAGGLGVLVGIQARARAQGITVALTGLRPAMIRLLAVAGLGDRFPVIV